MSIASHSPLPPHRARSSLPLLGAAWFILTAAPLSAQHTAALRGWIRDATSGRALEAAQVTLLPSGVTLLSDVDGSFVFARVPAGTRALRVLRLGYAPWQRDVEPGAAEVDVTLEPQPQHVAGITVVGPGRGSLVRIPGSATVLDRAQLTVTQPLSGNEMFKFVPGVNVQEEEGLGLRVNIGVRGLDPDRSRTVLVLEDGVPVSLNPYGEPEMYYTPPIERMERVEIVKGSGSVLFGPQTVGGVVNYVTPEPPQQPGGSLEVVGGSGRFALGHLAYGGRWEGTGALASLLRRQAADIRGLFFEQTDATGKVVFDLGEHDVLGAKLSVYDELSNATYVGLTDSIFRADPDFYPGAGDRLRIRRYAVTVSHDRQFTAGRMLRTAIYGYTTTRDWQRQDYGYTSSGNNYTWRNSSGNRNRSFDVLGIEPRLHIAHRLGEFEGGIRAHYERARDQHINGQTATSRTGEIRDDEIRTGHAFAAFAHNRFQLGERLRLTPGVRLEYFAYDRHILRTRVRRLVRDSTGAVIGTTFQPEDVDLRSGDRIFEVIPGIGVTWFASGRASFFAGVHRGFAPPRIKDALVYPDSAYASGVEPGDVVSLRLDPERSWNLELGTRSQPLPGVSFEATLFALDFSNQIIEPSLSSGSVAQARLANQGETTHRGFETALDVDWGQLAGWLLSVRTELRYTYSDARFSNDRFLSAPNGDTVNIKHNRLPYAPRHLATLSTILSLPGRYALKLDRVHVGEQFADNFETRLASANGRNGLIPAQVVWNASGWLALPGTRLRLEATVKNLTNATYIASRRPEGIKPGVPHRVHVGMEWEF
jgi:Fe(3+) dicitrate transport protein